MDLLAAGIFVHCADLVKSYITFGNVLVVHPEHVLVLYAEQD